MVNPHVRRLTVMLHADVISSTTLVQKDEALAHQRMQDAFHKFSTTIESYGGKTLELRGDALLAEFGRASDAVCAALAFQAANTQYNKMVDDDVRAELRVGLSLGEVIIADDTVTGAGVVLAQRLEQLANPGGVVIQGWISMDEALSSAVEDSSRGLQLDVNEPWCYIARAFIAIATLDSETCLASAKKAIELSPSFAYAHSVYGLAIALSGHGKNALPEVDMAMRLSPRDVWREEFYLHYAMAYFQAGDYEAATLNAAKASLPRPGHATPYWMLMAALGQHGLMGKAQEASLRMKMNVPGFALTEQTIPRIYVLDADHARLIDGLDKAGVLGV